MARTATETTKLARKKRAFTESRAPRQAVHGNYGKVDWLTDNNGKVDWLTDNNGTHQNQRNRKVPVNRRFQSRAPYFASSSATQTVSN